LPCLLQAKLIGNDIAAKQRQGEETERQIDEARTAYAPCGDYLSTLFFCISGEPLLQSAGGCGAGAHAAKLMNSFLALFPAADLASIDPMYQYSLAWFIRLVHTSLAQAPKPDNVPQRLEAIHNHFTANLYRNVCRWAVWSNPVCAAQRAAWRGFGWY
jgi:dynein heavy chain